MKTEWIAAVLLAIVIALVLTSSVPKAVREGDAKNFVLEDLRDKYPDADEVSILSSELQTGNGSQYYYLKAKVVRNAKTPCPERIHVYYNYPLQNFVTQPPEYITRGCKVCINEPVCLLAFEEDAIIASHTYPGAEEVANYIREFPDAQPTVSPGEGIWEVDWDSGNAGHYYKVVLSKSGNSVQSAERVAK